MMYNCIAPNISIHLFGHRPTYTHMHKTTFSYIIYECGCLCMSVCVHAHNYVCVGG